MIRWQLKLGYPKFNNPSKSLKQKKVKSHYQYTSQNKGSDKIWRLFSRSFFVQIYKINSPESSFVFLFKKQGMRFMLNNFLHSLQMQQEQLN